MLTLLRNPCIAPQFQDNWGPTTPVPALTQYRQHLANRKRTQDDIEDDIAACVRDGFPGVYDLLLEFIEERVVLLLLLALLLSLAVHVPALRLLGFHRLFKYYYKLDHYHISDEITLGSRQPARKSSQNSPRPGEDPLLPYRGQHDGQRPAKAGIPQNVPRWKGPRPARWRLHPRVKWSHHDLSLLKVPQRPLPDRGHSRGKSSHKPIHVLVPGLFPACHVQAHKDVPGGRDDGPANK